MGQSTAKTGSESGRFKPGQSGNPKGRPHGSRNRASLIAETLLQGEVEQIARTVVDRALAGDSTCLRLCLERLMPPLKERPLSVTIPPLQGPESVPGAIAGLLGAIGSGELLPSEGAELARVVETYRKAAEYEDLTRRVAQLERELEKRGR